MTVFLLTRKCVKIDYVNIHGLTNSMKNEMTPTVLYLTVLYHGRIKVKLGWLCYFISCTACLQALAQQSGLVSLRED
jgi:hypothetical protein